MRIEHKMNIDVPPLEPIDKEVPLELIPFDYASRPQYDINHFHFYMGVMGGQPWDGGSHERSYYAGVIYGQKSKGYNYANTTERHRIAMRLWTNDLIRAGVRPAP